jgi:hypothetical protein
MDEFYVNVAQWNGKTTIIVRDAHRVSRHDPPHLTPDPRYLGVIPRDFLDSAVTQPDSFFTPTDEGITVETEAIAGEECVKLSYTCLYGTRNELWLVPRLNHAVIKARSYRVEKPTSDRVVESELAHYANTDIWFPTVVTFTERQDGAVICTQHLTVARALFNDSAAVDKMFSIANIPTVQAGDDVNWFSSISPPALGPLTWNGEQIVGANAKSDDAKKGDQTVFSGNGVRFLWLNLAVLAGIVGIVLIARSFVSLRGRSEHKPRQREMG